MSLERLESIQGYLTSNFSKEDVFSIYVLCIKIEEAIKREKSVFDKLTLKIYDSCGRDIGYIDRDFPLGTDLDTSICNLMYNKIVNAESFSYYLGNLRFELMFTKVSETGTLDDKVSSFLTRITDFIEKTLEDNVYNVKFSIEAPHKPNALSLKYKNAEIMKNDFHNLKKILTEYIKSDMIPESVFTVQFDGMDIMNFDFDISREAQ